MKKLRERALEVARKRRRQKRSTVLGWCLVTFYACFMMGIGVYAGYKTNSEKQSTQMNILGTPQAYKECYQTKIAKYCSTEPLLPEQKFQYDVDALQLPKTRKL